MSIDPIRIKKVDEKSGRRGFFEFIKYNNFFTLIIMFVLLGSGVSLAANPNIRDGVYSESQEVRSIDNAYIISKDLSSHNFNLIINSVTEDVNNYYVSYSYTTIEVEDYVWKDVVVSNKLTVSKASLNGEDLGLFVARQIGEVTSSQLAYLKEVQSIETKKGISQKVVSTTYSGLVGRVFSPKNTVFEGYRPVIEPKKEPDNNNNVAAVAVADISDTSRSRSLPRSQKLSEAQSEAERINRMVAEILAKNSQQVAATTQNDSTVGTTSDPIATGGSGDTTTPGQGTTTSTDTSSTTPSTPTTPNDTASTTDPVVDPTPETPPVTGGGDDGNEDNVETPTDPSDTPTDPSGTPDTTGDTGTPETPADTNSQPEPSVPTENPTTPPPTPPAETPEPASATPAPGPSTDSPSS